jgi:hypothetical protein
LNTKQLYSLFGAVLIFFDTTSVLADGSTIDKVYRPYVEPLEWELEWRMTHENQNALTGEEQAQLHRFGLGKAVAETIFTEFYLIGTRSDDQSFTLAAYELELLWQISEQGEYAVDYGLLFEIEKVHHEDIWEFSTVLLLEKELGRYSATANLELSYESGSDIKDEIETGLALQGRYRYSPRIEPALELYVGEDTLGLGPVIMGAEKLGIMKTLRWQLGVIFAADSDTPDYTLRALLEYEF